MTYIDGSTFGAFLLIGIFVGFLCYSVYRAYRYMAHWEPYKFDFSKPGGITWHLIWATVWLVVVAPMAANFNDVSDSFREIDYEKGYQGFNMGNCDWKTHFRDAAYKSKLDFWNGGDEERGELSIFFRQECEQNPDGTATLMAQRKHHELIEPYRTIGPGGWDGTYPEWEAW